MLGYCFCFCLWLLYWIWEMFRMCGIFCFYYFNVSGGTHNKYLREIDVLHFRSTDFTLVFEGGRVFRDFVLRLFLFLCLYCCRLFLNLTFSLKSFGFGKSEFVYVTYLLVFTNIQYISWVKTCRIQSKFINFYHFVPVWPFKLGLIPFYLRFDLKLRIFF